MITTYYFMLPFRCSIIRRWLIHPARVANAARNAVPPASWNSAKSDTVNVIPKLMKN